ncbi:hypothetical protein QQF64_025665 [Cirrhinus molitorella]|uniref:Secreted protein n=1 Tax=Cirrhinus molitorella TaxID=172907 RepID=A0ABR3NQ39_9TELE
MATARLVLWSCRLHWRCNVSGVFSCDCRQSGANNRFVWTPNVLCVTKCIDQSQIRWTSGKRVQRKSISLNPILLFLIRELVNFDCQCY